MPARGGTLCPRCALNVAAWELKGPAQDCPCSASLCPQRPHRAAIVPGQRWPCLSPGRPVSLGRGLQGRAWRECPQVPHARPAPCHCHPWHHARSSREGRWAKELWGLAGPGEPGTAAVPQRPRGHNGGAPRGPIHTGLCARGAAGPPNTPNPVLGAGGQRVPRWWQDGALQMCHTPRCAAAEGQLLVGPGGCRVPAAPGTPHVCGQWPNVAAQPGSWEPTLLTAGRDRCQHWGDES